MRIFHVPVASGLPDARARSNTPMAEKPFARSTPDGSMRCTSTSSCASDARSGHQMAVSRLDLPAPTPIGMSTIEPVLEMLTLPQLAVPHSGSFRSPAPSSLSYGQTCWPDSIMRALTWPGSSDPNLSIQLRRSAPATEAYGVAPLVPVKTCCAVAEALLAVSVSLGV